MHRDGWRLNNWNVRFGSKADIGKVRLMSALLPIADIGTQSRNVRFVPNADIAYLFDQLVRLREQTLWHRYADCPSRW